LNSPATDRERYWLIFGFVSASAFIAVDDMMSPGVNWLAWAVTVVMVGGTGLLSMSPEESYLMSASNYVHVEDCEVLNESEKALLIKTEDWEAWIPKSQIADWKNYYTGERGYTISITKWILDKRGLSYADD
jgi:hypothetical protein